MIKKLLFFGFLVVPLCSSAMSVTYYSIQSMPFQNNHAQARICYLDAPQTTLQSVQESMRDNATALKTMSNSEIAGTYRHQFETIGQSMICQFDAAKAGVKALPAVVINDQYVIYGQPDIDMAVREYHSYLERQHV